VQWLAVAESLSLTRRIGCGQAVGGALAGTGRTTACELAEADSAQSKAERQASQLVSRRGQPFDWEWW